MPSSTSRLKKHDRRRRENGWGQAPPKPAQKNGPSGHEESQSGPLSQVGAQGKGENIKRLRWFSERALISLKLGVLFRSVFALTGSVVENPHGLHLNTFRFSAKARLIVCSNVIGRRHPGQITSFVDVGSSLIGYLWTQSRAPSLMLINGRSLKASA